MGFSGPLARTSTAPSVPLAQLRGTAKISHLKPRSGTPAYSDEFPFQGRFAMRRAMQPPSPGDVLLVLAIAGVVLLIEIGMLILLVML
jgi:hypothetical protein